MSKTEAILHFEVEMRWVAGPDKQIDRNEVVNLVRGYLEAPEAPFREDYGHGAWGGYEGPFVLDVKVRERSAP